MDIFLFAIAIWFPFVNREDFERNGLTSIITVAVRDIQGQGFPEEHTGAADAVFLDLPQPWLAIPSAGTMLKQDGVLCSFSPCIEQVQRACEAMRSCFTGSMHAQNFFLSEIEGVL
jgi:tRNA (adenine57-N1/adenine58-N1)-methyltransferase